MSDTCKICNATTNTIFKSLILNKYDAQYYKCINCGFIQTEKPYWLEEAYASAISNLDIGLISRNIYFSEKTELIIQSFFNTNNSFIDYGGGYGMFVRMMRDKGLNFYRYDTYCKNIFANHFDTENNITQQYELATCFEVFEHLENPLEEITKILTFSNSILFSTELVPNTNIKTDKDWWYFLPETGQHIAFHTKKSLEIIASKFNLNFYSIDNNLHLFTPLTIPAYKLKLLNNRIYKYITNRNKRKTSLLQKDYKFLRDSI